MMTKQQSFAERSVSILNKDENVLGVAVGGSWLTNEMDAFSDLDLILVTKSKVGGDLLKMLDFAKRLPHFLSGFTGEHFGDTRVLICLYDKPLLHVDIKFVTLEEFRHRVENPILLSDKTGDLNTTLQETTSIYPHPDYQWIEDRFWTWIHYCLLKIGRGEYLEALDFFAFLRRTVFGPLLLIKNGMLPREVRKVEMNLPTADFIKLQKTIPTYSKISLLQCLGSAIEIYEGLRQTLYPSSVTLHTATEAKVLEYFEEIRKS
jgi:predicted nucleotidyltransferase